MNRKKHIRLAFRSAVFERDNYRCVQCQRSAKEVGQLDAHHITDRNEMPNGGYVLANGISLCPECHIQAEVWHASNHSRHVPGFHPDELYAKIQSSYEDAVRASTQ